MRRPASPAREFTTCGRSTAAVGDRFPENAILSHDLIEGEYARTGLLTSVEVVEDYPATYEVFAKRKHRWVRGDWQLLPWLAAALRSARRQRSRNPLAFSVALEDVRQFAAQLVRNFRVLLLVAGWLTVEHTAALDAGGAGAAADLAAYADMFLMAVSAPERRFWRAFVFNFGERVFEKHRDARVELDLHSTPGLLHGGCHRKNAVPPLRQ